MFSLEQVLEGKSSVLFVTAHPDDVVVFFGMLIATLRQRSVTVHVLTVTNGARGCRNNIVDEEELATLRCEEEIEALKVLGVPSENCHCLHYKDGEVESNMVFIGQIVEFIRKFKPQMVCTHEPDIQYVIESSGYAYIQHRDHRKVGQAVIDAVYPFARDRSFFPEHFVEGLESHIVYEILLSGEKSCNLELDLTMQVETKRQALAKHRSQFDAKKVESVLESFSEGGRNLEYYQYLKLSW